MSSCVVEMKKESGKDAHDIKKKLTRTQGPDPRSMSLSTGTLKLLFILIRRGWQVSPNFRGQGKPGIEPIKACKVPD